MLLFIQNYGEHIKTYLLVVLLIAVEQITPKLTDFKHLLSASTDQESGHSLAGCLWLRSS